MLVWFPLAVCTVHVSTWASGFQIPLNLGELNLSIRMGQGEHVPRYLLGGHYQECLLSPVFEK